MVDEVVKFKGLVDIGLELRVQERSLDFLEEKLADGTLEFGGNFLGLHADVHWGHGPAAIRFLGAGEHAAEGRLAGTVLAHHDYDFRVGELARFDGEVEAAQSFLHAWVAVVHCFVREVFVPYFGNAERERFVAKAEVLCRDVAV